MTCKNVAVTNSAGNTIIGAEEVREIWGAYIEYLYDQDGKPTAEDTDCRRRGCGGRKKGPTLLRSKILAADT